MKRIKREIGILASLFIAVSMFGFVGCAVDTDPNKNPSDIDPPSEVIIPNPPPPDDPKNNVLSVDIDGGKLRLDLTSADPVCSLTVNCSDADKRLSFESTDTSVIKVLPSGRACGISAGNAAIKVKHIASGEELLIPVECTGAVGLESASITPQAITLDFFDTQITRYGFTWHMRSGGYLPVIELSEGGGEGTFTPEIRLEAEVEGIKDVKEITSFNPNVINTYTDYVLKAAVGELKPDTEYGYRVGDYAFGQWSEVAVFRTKREQKDISEFTFINISDTQENTSDKISSEADSGVYSKNAFASAFAKNPEAEFILHGGDMAEWSEYANGWMNMLDVNKDVYRSVPTMMVTGNHETTYKGTSLAHYRHYNVEIVNNQEKHYGFYYTFDYGDARFIVLNTNVLTSNKLTAAQESWLKTTLQSSNKKWTIVAMHNPMYSPAKWGSQTSGTSTNTIALALRWQLLKIFNDNGVDLVIQGHDHVYMATYPIGTDAYGNGVVLNASATKEIGGVQYFENPNGVVFHMPATGGSGKNSKVAEANMDYYYDYQAGKASSWSVVSVSENTLTLKSYYYDSGTVNEYGAYGIYKA